METSVSFHCNSDTGITRNVCTCHRCCVVTACEKLCCNQMIRNLMEHAKIGRIWPFYIETCFMVLCITPVNFRSVPEILKELRVVMLLFRTDRQTAWQMSSLTHGTITIPIHPNGGQGLKSTSNILYLQHEIFPTRNMIYWYWNRPRGL